MTFHFRVPSKGNSWGIAGRCDLCKLNSSEMETKCYLFRDVFRHKTWFCGIFSFINHNQLQDMDTKFRHTMKTACDIQRICAKYWRIVQYSPAADKVSLNGSFTAQRGHRLCPGLRFSRHWFRSWGDFMYYNNPSMWAFASQRLLSSKIVSIGP